MWDAVSHMPACSCDVGYSNCPGKGRLSWKIWSTRMPGTEPCSQAAVLDSLRVWSVQLARHTGVCGKCKPAVLYCLLLALWLSLCGFSWTLACTFNFIHAVHLQRVIWQDGSHLVGCIIVYTLSKCIVIPCHPLTIMSLRLIHWVRVNWLMVHNSWFYLWCLQLYKFSII